MTDILTIDEILKRKDLIDNNEYKYYHSKVFNMDIEVDECDAQVVLDILGEDETEYRRYKKLIYECCPVFKATELHQAYADRIKEPYDIINAVFNNNISEIIEFGNFILKKYGFLNQEQIENIKKQ